MERYAAGAIVFFSLIVIADIPSLSLIAVAFAYLILLSAAMTVGPVAFGRLSTLVGAAPVAGGGGGGKKRA
jgi:hypothetical protein